MGLLSGIRWASGALTYSFPSERQLLTARATAPTMEPGTFSALNAAQQSAARATSGDALCGGRLQPTFAPVRVESATRNYGTLRFGMSSAPGTSWAYYPSTNAARRRRLVRQLDALVRQSGRRQLRLCDDDPRDRSRHGPEAPARDGLVRRHAGRPRFPRIFGHELPLLHRRLDQRRLHQRRRQLSADADDVRHRRAADHVWRQLRHQRRRYRLQLESDHRRGVRQRRRPGRASPATRSS